MTDKLQVLSPDPLLWFARGSRIYPVQHARAHIQRHLERGVEMQWPGQVGKFCGSGCSGRKWSFCAILRCECMRLGRCIRLKSSKSSAASVADMTSNLEICHSLFWQRYHGASYLNWETIQIAIEGFWTAQAAKTVTEAWLLRQIAWLGIDSRIGWSIPRVAVFRSV